MFIAAAMPHLLANDGSEPKVAVPTGAVFRLQAFRTLEAVKASTGNFNTEPEGT